MFPLRPNAFLNFAVLVVPEAKDLAAYVLLYDIKLHQYHRRTRATSPGPRTPAKAMQV